MVKKLNPKKTKKESILPDDDIIELTNVVDDNDDVIDLMEAVAADDEDVIELVDVVDNGDAVSTEEFEADRPEDFEGLTEDDSELEAGDLLDMLDDDEEEVDLLDAVEDDQDAIEFEDAVETEDLESVDTADSFGEDEALELEGAGDERSGEMVDTSDEDEEDLAELAELADITSDITSDDETIDDDEAIELDTGEDLESLDDNMESEEELLGELAEIADVAGEDEEVPIDSIEDLDRLELDDAFTDKADVSDTQKHLDQELIDLIEDINGKEDEGDLDEIAVDADDDLDEIDTGSEEDLLEPDEEIDVAAQESIEDQEQSQFFADSLGDDLDSALDSQVPLDEPVDEDEGLLNRPGILSVQVENQREGGPPIDFKFQSKLYPGDKFYKEKRYAQGNQPISQKHIEETVKRVVKDLVGEKIDNMIVDIIEKTVAEEIQRLKDLLTGSLNINK